VEADTVPISKIKLEKTKKGPAGEPEPTNEAAAAASLVPVAARSRLVIGGFRHIAIGSRNT